MLPYMHDQRPTNHTRPSTRMSSLSCCPVALAPLFRAIWRALKAGGGHVLRLFAGCDAPAALPRQRPAVATRVRPREQHPVFLPPDDLDAARAFEIADRVDRVTASRQLAPYLLREAAF